MVDKNFQNQTENNAEQNSKGKSFWKGFGLIMLSLGLAVLTVIVLNLSGVN